MSSSWFKPEQVSTFFDHLFQQQKEGYLELRCIGRDGQCEQEFFPFPLDQTKIINYIEPKIGEFHIFFGINPRVKKEGSKDSIVDSIGLWADLDGDDYDQGKQEARKRLINFPLTPTLIVDSGNGYHAYWITDENLSVDDAEHYNRRLSYELGSDSVSDIGRILRVPGTPNIKHPRDSSRITDDPQHWTMCEIESIEFTHPDLTNFDQHLPDISSFSVETNVDLSGESSIETISDCIDIVSDSSILDRAKTIPDHCQGDRSANDFWVACRLYEQGFDDADVYRSFELFKKHDWDAGKKFADRGPEYLTDCTLPAAKQEVGEFEVLLESIQHSTGTQQTRYVKKALQTIQGMDPIDKELRLKDIKEASGDDLTLGQLRKQARKTSKFNARRMAESILDEHEFLFTGGQFRYYDNGVFREGGQKIMHRILQKRLGESWTTTKRNEVREWIKDHTRVSEANVGHPSHLINVKNGMYNIRRDQLLPHNPSHRSLTQIHVAYDPDATCNRLDQFVDEVFPNQTHPLIWQHAGYVLLRDLQLKKFLVLQGAGNNGKSVWLNLIGTCLGKENVAHEGLSDLTNNRYSVQNLFGKLANIHADIESLPVKQTGTLKQLTGGDVMRAEIKYGDTFNFENKAKLLFAVNELPHVKDYNDAFFSRIHIVKCPNRFEGEDAETDLESKLTTEEAKSAWLNKAVDGAETLLEQKQFDVPPQVDDNVTDYRHQADSVTEFVDYHLVEDDGSYEKKTDVFSVYEQWCEEQGRRPVSLSTFAKRSNLEEFRPRLNGNRVRAFRNIRLSDLSMERFSQSIQIKR